MIMNNWHAEQKEKKQSQKQTFAVFFFHSLQGSIFNAPQKNSS